MLSAPDLPAGVVTMPFAEKIRRDIVRRVKAGEGFDNFVTKRSLWRKNGHRPYATEHIGWSLINDDFCLLARTFFGKTMKDPGNFNQLLWLSSHAVARSFSRLNTASLDHLLAEFRPFALAFSAGVKWKDILGGLETRQVGDNLLVATPNGIAFCVARAGGGFKLEDGFLVNPNQHLFVKTWCSYSRLQDEPGHKAAVCQFARDLGRYV